MYVFQDYTVNHLCTTLAMGVLHAPTAIASNHLAISRAMKDSDCLEMKGLLVKEVKNGQTIHQFAK